MTAKAREDESQYKDMLSQREQVLWERQEELAKSQTAHFESSFRSLLSQNETMQKLLEQLISERGEWKMREEQLFRQLDRLQEENHELRVFIFERLASPTSLPAETRASPAEMGMLLDKKESEAHEIQRQNEFENKEIDTTSPQSSELTRLNNDQVSASCQDSISQETQSQAPSWTLELQAAINAVDEIDILSDDIDFSELARKSAAAKEAALRAGAQGKAMNDVKKQDNISNRSDNIFSERQSPEEHAAGRKPETPPTLSLGADDIFWVNQLHTAMSNAGYYAGDEDVEDFYFGESTQSAVLTYQCCEGLTETGVVDDDVWAKLLGPDMIPVKSRDIFEQSDESGNNFNNIAPANNSTSNHASKKPYAEFFEAYAHSSASVNRLGDVDIDEEIASRDTIVFDDGSLVQSSESSHTHITSWPVLMDGDGGREVHALHVALNQQGYYAGEDDVRWWQFGDGTINALKTFQACSGLPETGVCDVNAWRTLLGPNAKPQDLMHLRSGGSDDEDLSNVDGAERVWLLGEQRWENRKTS